MFPMVYSFLTCWWWLGILQKRQSMDLSGAQEEGEVGGGWQVGEVQSAPFFEN